MSYRLRLLIRIFRWLVEPRLDPMKEYRADYWVWPTEVELSVMENARYGYLLVLERFRLIFGTGAWREFLRRGWTSVMGAQIYKVKRPLKRWQKFTIITKPITWDDKWVYFEQKIVSNEKLICTAVISVIVLAKDRKIPTQEARELFRIPGSSPPFSDAVQKFIQAEQALGDSVGG